MAALRIRRRGGSRPRRAGCRAAGPGRASYIEDRSAWGGSVSELQPGQVATLKAILDDNGIKVSAVASPIGKVDVSLPVEHEVQRLRQIIAVAKAMGEGDGELDATIAALKAAGFASLEPHLASAHESGGFSGPAAFGAAARAFAGLAAKNGVTLS